MSDTKKFLAYAALYYYLGEVFYIDIGQPAAPQYFLPPIPITIALLWLIQYSSGAFAEFINGLCVVRGISAILHVDISAAMVHVANLLRFRGRHGDFYIFSERDDNFTFAADNLRGELIFLADTANRADLLLHDVALSIAGVFDGDLSDELARSRRIYPRNDRFADCRADFIAYRNFIVAELQSSREIFKRINIRHGADCGGGNFANWKFCRADFLRSANFNGEFI